MSMVYVQVVRLLLFTTKIPPPVSSMVVDNTSLEAVKFVKMDMN